MTAKILVVFGTRPEAIKMAPLVKALQQAGDLKVEICVTAQHRQMLDQVMDLFSLKPDYDLNIMVRNQTLTHITSACLQHLGEVFRQSDPQLVMVHGDTTTTFSAALAAFYHKIPVAHLEAGLRTYQKHAPWPEEINRQLVDRISDLYFAPTEQSAQNLYREQVPVGSVYVTGNTVIDALFLTLDAIKNRPFLGQRIMGQFGFLNKNQKLVLVTCHRRENFGEGIRNLCHSIEELLTRYQDIQVVYPVHRNPQILEPVQQILGKHRFGDRLQLIEPLDYESFVYLMERSHLILSDSGGVQEEAPSLGKPVIVLREATERPEAVAAGTVVCVGSQKQAILDASCRLLEDAELYREMAMRSNPYGDGKSSERIVEHLRDFLSNPASHLQQPRPSHSPLQHQQLK